MTKFFAINKDVLPLKANLAVLQAKYEKAQAELQKAEIEFKAKEKELSDAQTQFTEAEAKKNAVLDDAKKCQEKMDAATALIEGLSGERIRWTDQLAQFKNETDRLVGDVIVLSAFLSYAGPFNQEFRTISQNAWYDEILLRRVPVSKSVNVTTNLIDMATIGKINIKKATNISQIIEIFR